MSDADVTQDPMTSPPPAADPNDDDRRDALGRRLIGILDPKRIGGIYVLGLVVVVFAIWVPNTFLTVATVKQVFNQNATAGLVGLALILPLAAGVYDLSVAGTLGL